MPTSDRPYLALLGGSFNPPHIGHFRLAVEACEALKPAELIFIPCAVPPHKPAGNLLPFALREQMVRAGLAEISAPCRFSVSAIETTRSGPSYTVDTLTELAALFSDFRMVFIMGSEDYEQLPSWRRWRDIPTLADLAIFPRTQREPSFFAATTLATWPDAQALPDWNSGQRYAVPGGGTVLYFPQPVLHISSSLIRERFLAGRSVDYLMPQAVLRTIEHQRDEIRSVWLV